MIPELNAAIAGLKAMKDTTKFLADVSKQFDQVELRLKIIELVGQVQDMAEQLGELKTKLALQEQMIFRDGLYWKAAEDHAPYCPNCFDLNGKAVHLHTGRLTHGGTLKWKCHPCKQHFRELTAEEAKHVLQDMEGSKPLRVGIIGPAPRRPF